jgi:hypothetical protein
MTYDWAFLLLTVGAVPMMILGFYVWSAVTGKDE